MTSNFTPNTTPTNISICLLGDDVITKDTFKEKVREFVKERNGKFVTSDHINHKYTIPIENGPINGIDKINLVISDHVPANASSKMYYSPGIFYVIFPGAKGRMGNFLNCGGMLNVSYNEIFYKVADGYKNWYTLCSTGDNVVHADECRLLEVIISTRVNRIIPKVAPTLNFPTPTLTPTPIPNLPALTSNPARTVRLYLLGVDKEDVMIFLNDFIDKSLERKGVFKRLDSALVNYEAYVPLNNIIVKIEIINKVSQDSINIVKYSSNETYVVFSRPEDVTKFLMQDEPFLPANIFIKCWTNYEDYTMVINPVRPVYKIESILDRILNKALAGSELKSVNEPKHESINRIIRINLLGDRIDLKENFITQFKKLVMNRGVNVSICADDPGFNYIFYVDGVKIGMTEFNFINEPVKHTDGEIDIVFTTDKDVRLFLNADKCVLEEEVFVPFASQSDRFTDWSSTDIMTYGSYDPHRILVIALRKALLIPPIVPIAATTPSTLPTPNVSVTKDQTALRSETSLSKMSPLVSTLKTFVELQEDNSDPDFTHKDIVTKVCNLIDETGLNQSMSHEDYVKEILQIVQLLDEGE